jgi:hypothetical protein
MRRQANRVRINPRNVNRKAYSPPPHSEDVEVPDGSR